MRSSIVDRCCRHSADVEADITFCGVVTALAVVETFNRPAVWILRREVEPRRERNGQPSLCAIQECHNVNGYYKRESRGVRGRLCTNVRVRFANIIGQSLVKQTR
jgi:hypothetical protein